MNPQKMTAIKQGLEFCEFLWREVPLNDYAHEQRQQLEVALRAVLAEEGQPYHKQAQYFKSAGVGVLINPVTGDVGIGTPTKQPDTDCHAQGICQRSGYGIGIITPAELSAALGWPGGISEPVLDKAELLKMVANARVEQPEQEPVARDDLREDPRDPNDFIDSLRGLDTNARVRFYEHDFYVLSNFSAFTLHWREQRFDTSEAAYHYEKFPHARHLQEAIRCAPSAHAAFKLAERNKAERRPDWDDVKVQIMLDILRAKVRQHDYVRRKLLETGDRELVEDSWRDDFWGWGPNRDGHNMLGKLWMEVRAELRATTASRQDAAVPWLA